MLVGILLLCFTTAAAQDERPYWVPTDTPPRQNGLDPNGGDISTITDFKGAIGSSRVGGFGTSTTTLPDSSQIMETHHWVADLRFMQGEYRARDGMIREKTWALI